MIVSGNSESGVLRHTLGPLGMLAAMTLVAVSMSMNYRFGYGLGKTPTDGNIYGAASAAADIFKLGAPFFFFWAWGNRRWSVAVVALLVWVVMTGFALTGAFGHAVLNRLATASQHTLDSTNYKDLRADKKRNEDQLSWLPQYRAVDTIKADLQGVKAHRFWTYSTECTEANGKAIRDFCASFHKLAAELGTATKADELNKKIEDISGKLSNASSTSTMTEADPQAGSIAKILNVDIFSVQIGLAVFIMLVIEFGSGFGPYIAFNYWVGGHGRRIIDAKYTDVSAANVAAMRDPATAGLPAPNGPLTALPSPQHLPQPASVPPSGELPAVTSPQAPLPPAAPVKVVRTPLRGSEPTLVAIGFSFDGKPSGPLRDKSKPKVAAERFVVWLRAYGLTTEPHSHEAFTALYAEFCTADHREPTAWNMIAKPLKAVRAVHWHKPRKNADGTLSRGARWEISPGKYPKPVKEGRLYAFPTQAEAPHEDVASEPPHREAHVDVLPFRRHDPLYAHERMKTMHRLRRERNHKQRCSRVNRRAA